MKLQVREYPEAIRHRSDLDIIRPEYKSPCGLFGVRAGACIRQHTVIMQDIVIVLSLYEFSCKNWNMPL